MMPTYAPTHFRSTPYKSSHLQPEAAPSKSLDSTQHSSAASDATLVEDTDSDRDEDSLMKKDSPIELASCEPKDLSLASL